MVADRSRKILVTGGAGFIGSHLVDKALAHGDSVFVIDNFNDYYAPDAKRKNITEHLKDSRYRLFEGDIRDRELLSRVFADGPYDVVVHLAAMAGVRPSLEKPALYMDVNVSGTQNIIDYIVSSSKGSSTQTKLVFGSSSSVYGARSGECFRETDRVDQPLSPYAASKAANELQCYAAHHTAGLEVVCLRFFTVFGPRQRPDLAIRKFTERISRGEEIEVYGDGTSKRDYTFVLDIIDGVWAAMERKLSGYDIINLGRSEPVVLMDMIRAIEKALDKQAKIVHKPFQTGDVPYTYASIERARELLGYDPKTPLDEGINKFVEWYTGYNKDIPSAV